MKIVHVEAGRHLYGGARQALYLLEGLQSRGFETLMICPRDSEVARAADLVSPTLPIAMRGELDVSVLFRIHGILRSEMPTVVHIHSRRGADFYGGVAARFAGVPAVLTRRVDNREGQRLARWKYRHFRRIVAISPAVQRQLHGVGVRADRLQHIPSAVDTRCFRPREERALHREFGLPADAPVLAMVAQSITRKGHELLFDALPQVLEKAPETRLVVFGRGPRDALLRRLAARRGLDRSVIWAGFRQDLPRLLPGADLLVHPAAMEGMGVVLLEAAACGVPVVATRVGGIPEVVQDGETGRLVAPRDPSALASAIVGLLASPELRAAMGRRARDYVERRFSVDHMVDRYVGLYQDIVRQMIWR